MLFIPEWQAKTEMPAYDDPGQLSDKQLPGKAKYDPDETGPEEKPRVFHD